ncbi:hypothetical protein QCA50_020304 [Cerrena zonata]|uniref:Dynein heavy chain tail domain-containing protein n=1 Tax=Cerrena zonata TaxID=2478898 RepID=A0AAW0FGP1_9APHY
MPHWTFKRSKAHAKDTDSFSSASNADLQQHSPNTSTGGFNARITELFTNTSAVDRQGRVRDAVKQLVVDVELVERSFVIALQGMQRAREHASSDGFRYELDGLIEKWKRYQTEFRNLLWKSRGIAGEAMNTVQDLTEVFFTQILIDQDNADGNAGIRDAIDEYSKSLDDKRERGQRVIDGFKELSHLVELFKNDWESLVEHHPTIFNSLKTEITLKINEAVLKLKEYRIQIVSLASHESIFKALSIVVNICWQQFTMTSDANFLSPSIKRLRELHAEKKIEVDKLRSQRAETLKDIQDLREILDFLSGSDDTFDTIQMKLMDLASVWTAIQGDLQQLNLWLGKLANPEFTNPQMRIRVYNGRVEIARKLYALLKDILSEYLYAVAERPHLFARRLGMD